jgi:hypothetical protein
MMVGLKPLLKKLGVWKIQLDAMKLVRTRLAAALCRAVAGHGC